MDVQKPQFKMVNVGILTKQQLDDLLMQFPKAALVHTQSHNTTVYGPDGRQVLSAARLASERWTVRAAEGMVQRAYSRHLTA